MFRVFGGERIRSMMSMFRIDDLPMESKMLVRPSQARHGRVAWAGCGTHGPPVCLTSRASLLRGLAAGSARPHALPCFFMAVAPSSQQPAGLRTSYMWVMCVLHM